MLQEAAGTHAVELGLDMEALRPHGLTWVLSKFNMKFPASDRPGWLDTVTVETWRAGLDRFFALRDYKLMDANGLPLVTATSFWALFEIEKRRLAMIPDFISATYPNAPKAGPAAKFEKIPRQTRTDHECRFVVERSDIDRNNHSNNVSYISWALDAVPEAVWGKARLVELDIIYRLETVLGDTIVSTIQQEVSADEPGALFLNHQLVREGDAKMVAQVRTHWAGRTS